MCDSIVHIQMHTCLSEPEGGRINQDSITSQFSEELAISFIQLNCTTWWPDSKVVGIAHLQAH
jgi:hypothetical protein